MIQNELQCGLCKGQLEPVKAHKTTHVANSKILTYYQCPDCKKGWNTLQ